MLEIFKNRKLNEGKLKSFGFKLNRKGDFEWTTQILNGDFNLLVTIDKSGSVKTNVVDFRSGDEYVLYQIEGSVGEFVGRVREAVENVLVDIREKCFDREPFLEEQTKNVIAFVKRRFGDELEFLWEKFPKSAIWRRKDNQKWYGLLTVVFGSKLGLKENKNFEVLGFRINPQEKDRIVDGKRVLEGYHMNKNSWATIILDGRVHGEEVAAFLEKSYDFADKPKKKG